MLFNYHCFPVIALTSVADLGCCSSVSASAESDNHFLVEHLDKKSIPIMSQKSNQNNIKEKANNASGSMLGRENLEQ